MSILRRVVPPARSAVLLAATSLVACRPSSADEGPSRAPVSSAYAPAASADEHVAAAVASGIASALAAVAPPEGMLLVPAGTSTMGADVGGEADEHAAHPVTLPAFFLDVTEVTNEAYARCVDAKVCGPIDPKSADKNGIGPDARFRGPRQPVSAIAWTDARAYCAWLGKRLPTEAEWERAARGNDARRYPWGDDAPTAEHAVFAKSVTEPVGTHPKGAGPFGHHDLAGNVWEWVEDPYDPLAYTREGASKGAVARCEDALVALEELRREGRKGFTGSNPIPTECERVLRGGAFNYPAAGLRSSNRVHHPGRYHLVMSGFRCASDAAPRDAGP